MGITVDVVAGVEVGVALVDNLTLVYISTSSTYKLITRHAVTTAKENNQLFKQI